MGLFGSENSRNIKRLKKIADKVVALEDEFKKKTDDQLRETTKELQERLKSILPKQLQVTLDTLSMNAKTDITAAIKIYAGRNALVNLQTIVSYAHNAMIDVQNL